MAEQVLLKDGEPITRGARIEDFNGNAWEYLSVISPRVAGRSGKVEVVPWGLPSFTKSERRTLYVTVFPQLSWSDNGE